jgi:hypothetical protein
MWKPWETEPEEDWRGDLHPEVDEAEFGVEPEPEPPEAWPEDLAGPEYWLNRQDLEDDEEDED